MKMISTEEISKWIESLYFDAVRAGHYFRLATKLQQTAKEYRNEVEMTRDLWNHVYFSLMDATLLHLCRVYDRTSASLEKLLTELRDDAHLQEEVKKFYDAQEASDRFVARVRELDRKRLETDLSRVSSDNQLVKTFRLWRDKHLTHAIPDDFRNPGRFEKEYPLKLSDIQKLIDNAFEILTLYSECLLCSYKKINEDFDRDYGLIFEAIRQQKRSGSPKAS